ncbi:MAG TPA: c-type cytochrome [Candidatus Binatia bacterium]|nr:c-type cytochrome [Candidatus Binatia bacterium]
MLVVKRGMAMKQAVKNVAILALGVIAVLWVSPNVAQTQSSAFVSQDPVAGSRVFGSKGCANCHAVSGVGGKLGPDLGGVSKPRSFYDLASALWNHLPAMVEQMQKRGISPAQLSAREAGDLIAFLATVNYFEPVGDAKKGKKVFAEKQCVVCHQIERVGGVFGPSLDSIVQFGPIFFAAAMWNHGPAMTEAMQARGIKRPVFTGTELRDFVAYVQSVSRGRGDQPVHMLPGRAENGERLFASRGCVDCHGVGGGGGPIGPALAGRKRYPSLYEFAAAMWNKEPAMTREMKRRVTSIPPLDANELADIIGYLYSVDYFAERGDARKGEQIVNAKGCLSCHSARGKGGRIAPAFEKIGRMEQPVNVVAAMWNHGAGMEKTVREQALAWPIFKDDEMAHVVAFLGSLGRTHR